MHGSVRFILDIGTSHVLIVIVIKGLEAGQKNWSL